MEEIEMEMGDGRWETGRWEMGDWEVNSPFAIHHSQFRCLAAA